MYVCMYVFIIFITVFCNHSVYVKRKERERGELKWKGEGREEEEGREGGREGLMQAWGFTLREGKGRGRGEKGVRKGKGKGR